MTRTSLKEANLSHISRSRAPTLRRRRERTFIQTELHLNGLKYVFFLDDVEVCDIGTTEEFRVEGDFVLEAAIEGSDEDDDGGEIKQKNDEQK